MKLLFLFILLGYCSTAQVFTIDNGHTAVTSKVLRFDVVKVVGRFNSVSGTIRYDNTDPSKTSALVTVLADSYSANNPEGEKAIKSTAFLDVSSYPEIKFVTKSFTKAGVGFDVAAVLHFTVLPKK